jgi:hypothetical protein
MSHQLRIQSLVEISIQTDKRVWQDTVDLLLIMAINLHILNNFKL